MLRGAAWAGHRADTASAGDHHQFDGREIAFADGLAVVVTEKDAVKLRHLPEPCPRCWYLEVDVTLGDTARAALEQLLQDHGISRR
ncbi:MAG: tetraacyldisaccharide 4'-kinase [Pseudomonadales bacterium]